MPFNQNEHEQIPLLGICPLSNASENTLCADATPIITSTVEMEEVYCATPSRTPNHQTTLHLEAITCFCAYLRAFPEAKALLANEKYFQDTTGILPVNAALEDRNRDLGPFNISDPSQYDPPSSSGFDSP